MASRSPRMLYLDREGDEGEASKISRLKAFFGGVR
jgi:hypothetical protein